LHSTAFDFDQALSLAKKSLIGVKNAIKNPYILNERAIKYLNEGLAYIYGRDRSYRPVLVLNLFKIYWSIKNRRIQDHMLRTLVMQMIGYSEERLFIKGKVETFILVADCKGLGYLNT
jgi:CRAL/TRIO domain